MTEGELDPKILDEYEWIFREEAAELQIVHDPSNFKVFDINTKRTLIYNPRLRKKFGA